MSKKIRSFFTAVCLFTLVLMGFGTVARAADTGVVTSTVTAQNISITITTSGTVAFGTVNTSSTKDTTTGGEGVNDSETAQNNGNITENFNIKAVNSTSSGAGWTMGAAAGADTYTIKSCVSDCDGTPTWNAIGISPSYESLATSISSSSSQEFDLQVHTPTSTTDYNEQTMVVTVQAVSAA